MQASPAGRRTAGTTMPARSLTPARSPLPPMPEEAASSAAELDDNEALELTEAEVLRVAAEGETLADVVQLLYRHQGLTSLKTPATVDFSELVSLRVLSLSHNYLVDISPVAELPCLVELNVVHNQIVDLSPVFQCEALEILLAANNHVASIEGIELKVLRRLSLFCNQLADFESLLQALSGLPRLCSLDIGGNPCFEDPSQRYGLIRAVPTLEELDGDALRQVDRQLAVEFFSCAEEMGFQERPRTAQRPKTAPAVAGNVVAPMRLSPRGARAPSGRCSPTSPSPSPSRRARSPRKTGTQRSRGSSRAPSPSPAASTDAELLLPLPCEVDAGEPLVMIEKYTSHVGALMLRLKTTEVDCENLRWQIQELRHKEPELGTAALRERLDNLQEANCRMHERNVENQTLRERSQAGEEELAARRKALGLPQELPQRPGSARPRSARPRTAEAAAEALVALDPENLSEADLRARNAAMRREIVHAKQRLMGLRAGACSAVLGRDISPPPTARGS